MTQNQKEQQHRIDVVNHIICEIARRGRKFFRYKEDVACIFERNGRLYMRNEYNKADMPLSTKFGFPPRRWHHGGTLWGLTKDFKEFIHTGELTNGKNGYGGLFSPHWGYLEADMEVIRAKAFELGYLKSSQP